MTQDNEGEERSTLACPKCEAPMEQAKVGEVSIDRCRGCGGLWLDALEKDKLLASTAHSNEADSGSPKIGRELDDQVQIICPRDGARMIHMVDLHQSHIGFESCKVCGGVFLDAGELRDLAHYSLAERLRSMLG